MTSRNNDEDDDFDTEKNVMVTKSPLTTELSITNILSSIDTTNNNYNTNSGNNITCSIIQLSVTEGKYRMVRRILHNSGHSVIKLHRVQYGNISLGDLLEGSVRNLTEVENEWATSLLLKIK